MIKRYLLRNKVGSALLWMLLVFTVLMLITTSIFLVVKQDVFETIKQEEKLQSYYIALAGIDITYAALMNPDDSPKGIEVAITKLKENNITINDTIEIYHEDELKGKAQVSIDRCKIIDPITGKSEYWVRITSLGQFLGSEMVVSSSMRINEENTNQIVREEFSQ